MLSLSNSSCLFGKSPPRHACTLSVLLALHHHGMTVCVIMCVRSKAPNKLSEFSRLPCIAISRVRTITRNFSCLRGSSCVLLLRRVTPTLPLAPRRDKSRKFLVYGREGERERESCVARSISEVSAFVGYQLRLTDNKRVRC